MQSNPVAVVAEELGTYYKDVFIFNECAGLLTDKPTWDDFEKLFKILKSEFHELEASFPLKDAREMVDGVADVTYVIFGMIALLEKSGFDVVELLKRVAENNNKKIYKTVGDALDLLVESEIAKPSLAPYAIGESFVDNEKFFVVLDKNGKVCKSINHVSPNIVELLGRWNTQLDTIDVA